MWILSNRGLELALLHSFVLKEEDGRFSKCQSFIYLFGSWFEFKQIFKLQELILKGNVLFNAEEFLALGFLISKFDFGHVRKKIHYSQRSKFCF